VSRGLSARRRTFVSALGRSRGIPALKHAQTKAILAGFLLNRTQTQMHKVNEKLSIFILPSEMDEYRLYDKDKDNLDKLRQIGNWAQI
jgi:hypothetical protein